MNFAPWEQLLLIFLASASAAVFVKDLTPKVRQIRAGPPDRIRTDRPGTRVLRVLREVLFQSRVIKGRPIVGLLHAFVFVGFLFFAFETIDHFLEPFGIPFLSMLLGSAEPVFKAFLAGIAILVAIAITGLAFRRFVLVKISPDPKSWSSGLVALMIFVLMITYLYGITDEPRWAKANWWLHSIVIIVFPPLILRSKHFHILLAPINVFFRSHRLGDYRPLDLEAAVESEDDVSLGLESMADTSRKMRMDFLTCVECKRCTDQCPANSCGQALDPREFILAGRAMLGTDGPVIGNVISEDALGECTSCGACENICPTGIEHLQLLLGAKRAQALTSGQGMVAGEFLETIDKYGNPFATPRQRRQQLIDELGIPIFDKGNTEYLLWLGCVWTYNEDARRSLEALIRVFRRAGVSYGVLAEESCSGHHSRRQGEEFQFQTLAGENIARLHDQAVTKIVTPCPHCYHTIGREYPTLDDNFSVETIHHSELLAQWIREGRLQLDPSHAAGKRLTYHDPCYLGRYEGIYDEPREVIAQAGFHLTELPRKRQRSFCCGGGNAGFAREQQVAKRVDQERKREIVASGANVLITSCPECKMMLNAAVEETLDLVELVARSSKDSEKGASQADV